MKRWILKTTPPIGCVDVEFTCLACGTDSLLPVMGTAIAQVGQGIIGDKHPIDIPDYIQCPNCKKEYERY